MPVDLAEAGPPRLRNDTDDASGDVMENGRIAELPRRGVVAVGGADAETFLNDLITSDVPKTAGTAAYGGLLTPQGKILFDFIVFPEGDRFLFDLPRGLVADFIKRLGFYRLRAKVEIADLSAERTVLAFWGGGGVPASHGVVVPDPRLAALGYRAIVPKDGDTPAGYMSAGEADYDAHRVRLGVHADLSVRSDGHHRRRGQGHHRRRQRRRSPAENPPDGLLRHQAHGGRRQEKGRTRRKAARPRNARRPRSFTLGGVNSKQLVHLHPPVLHAPGRRPARAAQPENPRRPDEARRPQERPHRRRRRRRIGQHAQRSVRQASQVLRPALRQHGQGRRGRRRPRSHLCAAWPSSRKRPRAWPAASRAP